MGIHDLKLVPFPFPYYLIVFFMPTAAANFTQHCS